MNRVVVVGEALVDIVPGPGPRELPGGSPANVALTLGRLGRRPTLVTALGHDERGTLVRAWLEGSGVDVVAAATTSGRTPTAAVVLDGDGEATYEFDLAWDLPAATLADALVGADVVHTGSIATVLEPGADVIEEALHGLREHCLICFDPNARPAITPDVDRARARVERLLSLTDVVKVSEEDLAWYYPNADPAEVALSWAARGPALVVVTRGANGATVVRGKDIVRVPGTRVDVADSIGAGDTFTGAFLDALLDRGVSGAERLASLTTHDLATAATWAARAAAVTVSRPGADPPTRAALT